jgi:hypothetical protein
MKKLLVLLFLNLSFLTQAQTRTGLITSVDFTKGLTQAVFGRHVYTNDGLTLSNETYKGQRMAQFKLSGTSNQIRSEIHFAKIGNQQVERIGFAMKFPSKYFARKLDEWFIIAQWHGSDTKDRGEASLQPHIALFIQSGRLKLAIRSDYNRISTSKTIKTTTYDLGPLVMDQVQVFYFYNYLSYRTDGVTTLSINGKQVVNHRAANNYNNIDPFGYLKLGIYCRGLESHEVYAYLLGNIYIGGKLSTWQSVLP